MPLLTSVKRTYVFRAGQVMSVGTRCTLSSAGTGVFLSQLIVLPPLLVYVIDYPFSVTSPCCHCLSGYLPRLRMYWCYSVTMILMSPMPMFVQELL